MAGTIHGKGTYLLEDGSKYEGEFYEGKRHGFAKFTWSDKRMYEGNFKDDKFEGKGYIWNPNDNSKLWGSWKNGKLDGKATLTDKSGNTMEYIYQEGELIENK